VELWVAGVKPQHLTDYRWAGCHTYQQILDAAREGITPKRVKYLRATHGKRPWGRPQIESFDALISVHRRDTAGAR
jgi:hypothetical protein